MNKELSDLAKSLLDLDFSVLSPRKKDVIEAIANEEYITEDVNREFESELTFGEKLADKVAQFGGSWTFISCAGIFLAIWIFANAKLLTAEGAFDPYPFILLNLALSMLAALQAPIILMSQNRQGEKDRLKVENNFRVTLKLELELTRLHQRLDQIEANLKKD